MYDQQNPDCPSERMNINPVKNSYAALWESYKEVKSGIPLKSIIRRILEYYFLQLCGYEGDDLRKCILEDHRDDFMYDENGAETPDRYEMAKVLLLTSLPIIQVSTTVSTILMIFSMCSCIGIRSK